MFDVGFSELCMVALVSLLVIGPERLPKVARMVGFWLGKMRSISANFRAEIQYELQVEEMKQLLQQQQAQLHAVENDVEHLSDLAYTATHETFQSQPVSRPTKPTDESESF